MARQAADEYQPGGFSGPEQWNKLQAGLDSELGKVRFNPFRAIRRMPFYYAPAVLLLASVAYYFIRHSSSGSPPPSIVKAMPRQPARAPEESVNAKNSPYKPTSTPDPQQGTNSPGNGSPIAKNPEKPAPVAQQLQMKDHAGFSGDHAGQNPPDHRVQGNEEREAGGSGIPDKTEAGTAAKIGDGSSTSHATRGRGHGSDRSNREVARPEDGVAGTEPGVAGTGQRVAGSKPGTSGGKNVPAVDEDKEMEHASIREQASRAGRPVIDDAGLREIAKAKNSPPGPITPGNPHLPSMRINRSLQFGLVVGPDFSSVNSLAGDRPGSSFGLTVDYQFVNKLYVSTGILFSRKNYTAIAQDYHVAYDYYVRNNMHNIDFVKGTINMLEIPLNVRYDFSVGGNTSFFASGGLSSYLLMGENCDYYFDLFGREAWRGFNYKGGGAHLFSAVNLSIGVETGLSNDLSLLISPYVKVPTGGLGFGGVDVNSMGINFGVKYAPVLRRSRH
ncbi:MAG: porin family protein [Bacteroidota bacterium]|nr:porin family protein [Bacteroidota bacterium]MDP4246861.1 porin family protein [Bacteroidota bacterium]MDP4254377.1 porin family protein [Bacteroidota bacterium]MDP4256932.1 porin family protein [Bacteroidota bacterium]